MPSENWSNREWCIHCVDIHLVFILAQCLFGIFLAWFHRFVAGNVLAHNDLIHYSNANALRVGSPLKGRFQRQPTLIISITGNSNKNGPLVGRAVVASDRTSCDGIWFGTGSDFHGLLPGKLFVVVNRRRPEFWDLHEGFHVSDVDHHVLGFALDAHGPFSHGNGNVFGGWWYNLSFLFLSWLFLDVFFLGHFPAIVAADFASRIRFHSSKVQVAAQFEVFDFIRNFWHGFHQLDKAKQVEADHGQSQQECQFGALFGTVQISACTNNVRRKTRTRRRLFRRALFSSSLLANGLAFVIFSGHGSVFLDSNLAVLVFCGVGI
mmetsp:Transcript_16096/g.33222  ORF Transcript_16096/g.33222 Transcript_16096/m.33222 type:complete len:321 (+) Transcript_16096:961-1923(+)